MTQATKRNIALSKVEISDDEVKAVAEVLRSGNLREGAKTREFEEAFRLEAGAKHAITASSGTAALHLVYQAMLQPGDEVLVPSFTFIATASTIALAGAKPIFCDVDPSTWTLDPSDLEKKITPRTKAIAGVHVFGNSCDITLIERIAKKHSLKIIWDAAQALGTRYQSKNIGQFPDAVCFSFYPSKNLTTGEGGMVTTDNAELAQKIRFLKSHGETEKYIHTLIGFNYRMTDMEASIGLMQLMKLDDFLKRRKEIALRYDRAFEKISRIRIQKQSPGSEHSYNYFSIVLELENLTASRDEFMKSLQNDGVQCAVYYPVPLHQQPCFVSGAVASLPVSEMLASRILSIPMHPYLTDEDVQFVIQSIEHAVSKYSK